MKLQKHQNLVSNPMLIIVFNNSSSKNSCSPWERGRLVPTVKSLYKSGGLRGSKEWHHTIPPTSSPDATIPQRELRASHSLLSFKAQDTQVPRECDVEAPSHQWSLSPNVQTMAICQDRILGGHSHGMGALLLNKLTVNWDHSSTQIRKLAISPLQACSSN